MKRLAVLYILGLFLFTPAWAYPVDVILDIDRTLAYFIQPSDPRPTTGTVITLPDGDVYRLSDDAEKFIYTLKKDPRIRLSFYSGARRIRNLALLERILLPDGSNAKDTAYKILSSNNLTPTLQTWNPLATFGQRWKKDLAEVNPDLKDLILLDDMADFAPDSQSRNVFWLQQVYDYFETFPYNKEKGRRIPPTKRDWALERKKLSWAMGKIQSALDLMENKALSFSDAVYQSTHDGKGNYLDRTELSEEKFYSAGALQMTPISNTCNSIYSLIRN